MKHLALLSTLFSTLLSIASPASADDRFANASLTITPLNGPVHLLVGVGGNIALSVGPDGVLMVDDQFAPLAERIAAKVATLGHGPVRWLVNTHWHGDHTGGNEAFGKTAHIVAHENVRKRLAVDQITAFGSTSKARAKHGLPIVTHESGLSLHLNGERIRLHHLPGGHTDGDSVVEFTGSGVWHLGDLFFNGAFPFVDLKHGGNVAQYAANVDRLVGLVPTDARIIPGHGPMATHADLVSFAAMLRDTRTIVEGHVRAQKTEQEAVAAGLPDRFAAFGKGFIDTPTWIMLVYRSARGLGMPDRTK